MEIIKLKKPTFGKWKNSKGEEINVPGVNTGGTSLGAILNSMLTQSTLCELKEELEQVEVKYEDYQRKYEKDPSIEDIRELVSREEKNQIAVRWGGEPDYRCISGSDITAIDYYDLDKQKETVDYYHTLEVLTVIEQWIEYLEKFYAEHPRD